MNGHVTSEIFPIFTPLPQLISTDEPVFKRIFTGELIGGLKKGTKTTEEIELELKEEEREKISIEKIIIYTKPISYIISFSVFLSLSVASGTLIMLSAFKNITIIDPFFLFYGFLASIGLTLTSWKGILSWK